MSCHVSAWMVALQEERRRFGGKEWQGVHFWGPQMKWFWRLKKAWRHKVPWRTSPGAAMAGVTAADHERISKNCPAKTRGWA